MDAQKDITNGFEDEFSNMFGEDEDEGEGEVVTPDTSTSTEKEVVADVTVKKDKKENEEIAPPELVSTEPAMDDQLDEQDKFDARTRKLKNQIFEKTGLKLSNNDPMIELVMILKDITEEELETVMNNLESTSDNIIDNIIAQQNKVDQAFDSKLDELKDVLLKLENQKEAIVMDVWRKLEQRVMDKIQSELTDNMKTIARNSNNNINNERMLLKGGVGGLIAGIFLCAVLLFIFL